MKIDGKLLLAAITKTIGMAGGDIVQMRLKDEVLCVNAVGSRTYAQYIKVKAPKENFEFAIPITGLTKNLKGVVDITCDKQVVVRTASFKAELAYQPYIDPEFKKPAATTVLTPDQIYQIESSLSYLSLSAMVEDVHYGVLMDENGFKACSFDRVHFGFYNNPTVKSKSALQLLLNLQDVNILLSAMESDREGFKMAVQEGFVHAWNEEAHLLMPLLQVSSQEGLTEVEGLTKRFEKASMKIVPTDLYEAIDRARAVADVTGSVDIIGEGNKLTVKASSTAGTFEEVVAANCNAKLMAMTDPGLMNDVLGRFHKTLEEVYVGRADRFMFFKFKADDARVTYGCLTKQTE